MHFKKTILATFIAINTLAPLTQPSYAYFQTTAKQAYLIDQKTNTILFNKEGATPVPPSSMTKLMTVYILLEHLKKGALSLSDTFITSEKAWRKQGSKMFLKHKEHVNIEDLLYGILVQSGNDAAIVVAENISVSESRFTELMNKTAKRLGLTETHFVNATGWPDDGHIMSARDIALLSQRIIEDFPEYYHYFSKEEFTYNDIKQQNRNSLLGKTVGVDGLKTGHTEIGGYGIAISAQRAGKRLIGILNGMESEKEREVEAERLLNYGFQYFENKTLFSAGDAISEATIWLGTEPTVPLVSKEDIVLSIPKVLENEIEIKVTFQGPIPAPITTGKAIATLHITVPEIGKYSYPLYASKEVQPVGWFRKIFSVIYYYSKEAF